jgi:hypothetical protein
VPTNSNSQSFYEACDTIRAHKVKFKRKYKEMKRTTVMKTISLFSYAILMTILCGSFKAPSFVQNIEVYVKDNVYYAIGEIDRKVYKTSRSARDLIQFAIDKAPKEGGKVHLQQGKYILDKPVSLKSNVWLQGSGRGTELLVAESNDAGIGVLCKGLKGAIVSDLSVKPVNRNTKLAGVVVDDCGDTQVREVFAQGFASYGIWLKNNSFLCEIKSCKAADNSIANIALEEFWEKGRGGDFVPNLVSNCITYRGGTGIQGNRALVVNVVGCVVYQPKKHGYHFFKNSNSVLISGCRTYQVEMDAVRIEDSHELNVSSNIFCWTRGDGIVMSNVSWAAINANNVIDCGTRDRESKSRIGIILNNQTKGVQVTGNTIFNWGDQPILLKGIQEDSTCLKNLFANNNINYYKEEAIDSRGKESVVSSNLVEKNFSYQSQGKKQYPDFETSRMDKFLNE